MENRKGSGIFLGIVGVATLIIAIIGATFAYFSASTTSNDDAVNLSAYEFKLSLGIELLYPEDVTSIIPLNPNTEIPGVTSDNKTNLLYAINEANPRCIDSNGLQVCALYQVSITNEAVNAVKLNGQLQTMSNNAAAFDGRTPFENLTYQAINGSHTDGSFVLSGTAATIQAEVGKTIDIAGIEVPGATYNDDGELVPGVGTSYILIYLNDHGDQSSEMGASFAGKLIYTSAGSDGNALTGTFILSPEPTEPEDEPTEENGEEPSEDPVEGE